ncbi:hypothetical protein [Bradyrhizobium sp. USDA 4506]
MTSGKQSVESMDALGRSIEKHLSRKFDQFYVEQGLASEHSIAVKNDFFRSLDLGRFSISAIGGRHVTECEQTGRIILQKK